MSAKAILIFIDGCGVPPAYMPGSSPLYNSLGILNADYIMGKKSNGFQYLGLDAQMQVEGIPQSATGQASIFTGLNTQKIMNGHLVAYPTRPLVNLILKNSLFLKLKQINKNPVFINAYTEDYFRILRQDFGLDAMNYQITDTDGFTGNIRIKHRFSVTTIQNLSVNNPFYSISDIESGKSVFHDIDGHTLVKKGLLRKKMPMEQVRDAFLYNIDKFDLVLFEYFLTDIYGHRQNYEMVHQSLCMLDDLITMLSIALSGQGVSIITASDHGNIEDLGIPGHTKNKALFIYKGAKGPAALGQLDEISDFIVNQVS